ncbi:hypothetical protein [Actinoplanes sp. NPDC026619]|uniref:hypothetical protein n=1 Tax=Actinoplanes sp. NPDC026619 TaxID=3155798 RepID=UPI0033E455A4
MEIFWAQPRESGDSGYEVILIFQPDEVTAQLIRQHVFTWEITERRREAEAS